MSPEDDRSTPTPSSENLRVPASSAHAHGAFSVHEDGRPVGGGRGFLEIRPDIDLGTTRVLIGDQLRLEFAEACVGSGWLVHALGDLGGRSATPARVLLSRLGVSRPGGGELEVLLLRDSVVVQVTLDDRTLATSVPRGDVARALMEAEAGTTSPCASCLPCRELA